MSKFMAGGGTQMPHPHVPPNRENPVIRYILVMPNGHQKVGLYLLRSIWAIRTISGNWAEVLHKMSKGIED